jgi:hypothetical protein
MFSRLHDVQAAENYFSYYLQLTGSGSQNFITCKSLFAAWGVRAHLPKTLLFAAQHFFKQHNFISNMCIYSSEFGTSGGIQSHANSLIRATTRKPRAIKSPRPKNRIFLFFGLSQQKHAFFLNN